MEMVPQGHRRPEGGDGYAVDRISGLPEELLLQLLAALGCAREAARTSVLSRSWRGLWTRLPEYTFDGVEPESVETALAQVTRPKLDLLDIKAELKSQADIGRASSLLRAAARLKPEELVATLSLLNRVEGAEAIELPCLIYTSSLALRVDGVPVTYPPAGEFTMLEWLGLVTGYIPDALLPSCPRLRVLHVRAFPELEDVVVHSATLEDLTVETDHMFSTICRIDIDTPELTEATLNFGMDREFSFSFSAPKMEQLDWRFTSMLGNVGLQMLRLLVLNYSLSHGVRTLRLDITCIGLDDFPDPDRSFAQEIARLPVTDFSVLQLVLKTYGHASGPLLLHLLQIRPAIQRLKLLIEQSEEDEELEPCPENCPCRQPINWKSHNISLADLEEVDVSFDGGDEDIDFLKLLFRCAPGIKRMNVAVSSKAYKEICNICEENPHVKCEVFCGSIRFMN